MEDGHTPRLIEEIGVRFVLDTPIAKVGWAIRPIGGMSPIRLPPSWVIKKLKIILRAIPGPTSTS